MGKIIEGYEQIKVNEHMEISSLEKKELQILKFMRCCSQYTVIFIVLYGHTL